jgi:hypothetical protein
MSALSGLEEGVFNLSAFIERVHGELDDGDLRPEPNSNRRVFTPAVALRVARQLTEEILKGKFRRSGRPELEHVREVSTMLEEQYSDDLELAAAGELHDIIEDGYLTADDLRAIGFSELIVMDVVGLDRPVLGLDKKEKPEKLPYFDYLELSNPRKRKIKKADFISNYKEVTDETRRIEHLLQNFSGTEGTRQDLEMHYRHEKRKQLRYFIGYAFYEAMDDLKNPISAKTTIPEFITNHRHWLKVANDRWDAGLGERVEDLLLRESGHVDGGRAAAVVKKYETKVIEIRTSYSLAA